VKVTNSGVATLTFSSIAATGDFALDSSTTTCGTTVAPGKSYNVGVKFTPTAPGYWLVARPTEAGVSFLRTAPLRRMWWEHHTGRWPCQYFAF
jgi:hypothetical protein